MSAWNDFALVFAVHLAGVVVVLCAGSLLLTVSLSCPQVPSRWRTARSALCLEERTAEGMVAQHSKVSYACFAVDAVKSL